MHLLLLESSSNQRYIFHSNRRRENVGASELIHSIGTWTLDACRQENLAPNLGKAEGEEEPSNSLRDPRRNPPLEEGVDSVEIVIALSGKAILLVNDRATGQKIIRAVTRRALREAPGLELRGAISEEFDIDSLSGKDFDRIYASTVRRREQLPLPSQEERFQRLPILAECTSSGLPASAVIKVAGERRDASLVSLAKNRRADQAMQRLQSVFPADWPKLNADTDSWGYDWLALIHADANGLGKVFAKFGENVINDGTGRQYVQLLREFSLAIDYCTRMSFAAAVEKWRAMGGNADMLPLILGGDDLTLICDGEGSVQLVVFYLEAFKGFSSAEDLGAGDKQLVKSFRDVIPAVLRAVEYGAEHLTVGAGVAIIKPHFPFFSAHQLAGSLADSAKCRGREVKESTLDFHALYDASGADLERIREHLTLPKVSKTQRNELLTMRPYVVGTDAEATWNRRAFANLQALVEQMRTRGDAGQEKLPGSMLHALREAVFNGVEYAMEQFELVRCRYDWGGALPNDGLYLSVEEKCLATPLLDALELRGFWLDNPTVEKEAS